MNKIRWYSSVIWDQEKYEKTKFEYSKQSDWNNYFTNNKETDFGVYTSILKSVFTDNKNKLKIYFMKFDGIPYYIYADVLLTDSRDNILKTSGIPVYMAICRLLRFLNKKGTHLKRDIVIKKAYSLFPSIATQFSPVNDIKEIIKSILDRKISDNDEEEKLWTRIKTYYFSFIYQPQALTKPIEELFEDKLNELKQDVLIDISNLIDYKKKLGDSKLRHMLLSDLGIKVCPYCNRNYITWYQSSDHRTLTTADLDHYYQKDYYPLFALLCMPAPEPH